MFRFITGTVVFIALIAGVPLRTEKITGTIYDPDGGVIAGVRVMLMQEYVKQHETKSDEMGEFVFNDVAPGMYQVQAKQTRFGLFQQTVSLQAGETARLYAILPLARMSDAIEINANLAAGVQRQKAATRELRAGGKVDLPKLIAGGRPPYPQSADARGVEGVVVLAATIKTDGSVTGIRTIGPADPGLALAAQEDIKNWRYQPMKLNGHPVDFEMTFVLTYRLR